MNKLKNTLWSKILCVIFCIIGVLGLIASGLGMRYTYVYENKNQMAEYYNKVIAANYSLYYLSEYENSNHFNPKKTNLNYAIYKNSKMDFEDGEPDLSSKNFEYTNFKEKKESAGADCFKYLQSDHNYSRKAYSLNSLTNILNYSRHWTFGAESMDFTDIADYVMDDRNGIIYAKGENGIYYEVKQFTTVNFKGLKKGVTLADVKAFISRKMNSGSDMNYDEAIHGGVDASDNRKLIFKNEKISDSTESDDDSYAEVGGGTEEEYEDEYEEDEEKNGNSGIYIDYQSLKKFFKTDEVTVAYDKESGSYKDVEDIVEFDDFYNYLMDSECIIFDNGKSVYFLDNIEEKSEEYGTFLEYFIPEMKTLKEDSSAQLKFETLDNDEIYKYPNYSLGSDRIKYMYNLDVRGRDFYWITSSVDTNYPVKDLFWQAKQVINVIFMFQNLYPIFIFIFAGLLICSFTYLMYSAGYDRNGNKNIRAFDKIPFEVVTFFAIIIELTLLLIIYKLIYSFGLKMPEGELMSGIFVLLAAFIIVGLVYCMSQSRKIKTGNFTRYSLVCGIIKKIKEILSQSSRNLPILFKFVSICIVVFLVDIIYIIMVRNRSNSTSAIILWMLLTKIVIAVIFFVAAVQLKILQEAGEKLRNGEYEQPLDTEKLYWEFKKHGDNLNRISEGIGNAVSDKIKSERFRTELITNVSHDIKTPLTSIINYVDLLKTEQEKNGEESLGCETVTEYLEVLERQSARLKKLIQDLIEASKASTGNLPVNMESYKLKVFITQIVGEFQEKLADRQLELITCNDENEAGFEDINVMADGRHLWRVIDNLMNNICKYAMAGSRVYIDIFQKEDKAAVVFKNISACRLNISSEELMERFVRGDTSRNTEGSGLGLSIAQSLAELMDGTLELEVDGDLFKVTLLLKLSDDLTE